MSVTFMSAHVATYMLTQSTREGFVVIMGRPHAGTEDWTPTTWSTVRATCSPAYTAFYSYSIVACRV